MKKTEKSISKKQISKAVVIGMAAMMASAMNVSAQNDTGRGRHKQFYVTPAPGKVVIDGKLNDWDLSGQIEMFVIQSTRSTQSAKIAAMYDKDALYLSGEIRDLTPMMNRHDPKVNPGRAWDADAVQFRITLDPEAEYPVQETTFKYKRNPDMEDIRDDITHLLLWYYTDEGSANLQMHKGMTYRKPRPEWVPAGLVPGDKFEGTYRKWDDESGYTFEYRIPWSTLGAERPLQGGDMVAGTVNVLWSRPDGLAHIRMQGAAYDIMGEPGFSFQNAACWGKIIFAEHGNLSGDLVRAGLPPERELPLEFSFDLTHAGETTVQLFTPEGKAARILAAQSARRVGPQTVNWDGLDDHGSVLPAGEYRWLGIVSEEPVKAEFRFSVHNSGRPPYTTDDGKGGWGGDHGTPQDATAIKDGMLLVWDSAEYGSGTIRVDLDGNKQWGTQSGGMHITTDGERYYTVGDRGFHRGLNVSILEVATARPTRLANGVASFPPPPGGTDDDNRVTGLAWHDGILYVSYHDRNLIARFSTVDGELKEILEVPKPERLAVTPDGDLLVVSEGKVVSCPLSVVGGDADNNKQITDYRSLITEYLDDPQGIAVGSDGKIYVANRGNLQNVTVFDADGTYLHDIGKVGGRPAVGVYERQGMLAAGGIAMDEKNRLWVAETLDGPKRISVWDVKTGENREEYFGASGYFSYGFIDPDRPDEILAHHVLWEIDWTNYTTRPKSTIWRQTAPDIMPSPGPYAYQHIPRLVTAAHGSQYMWGNTRIASILLRRDGDIFKPFAAMLDISGNTGVAVIDNNQDKWRSERHHSPTMLLWQDANDDQKVQEDELSMLPSAYNRDRFAWLDKDLTVRLGHGAIWRPVEIRTNGQPFYNPEAAEQAVVSGRTGQIVPFDDGSMITTGGRLSKRGPDGKTEWYYDDLIAWRYSLNLPILDAGRLWAMTGLMGVAGDFFALQTYFGVNQIFRTDGRYVGAILNDRRKVGRGPYAGQSEGQGGSFVKLTIDGKERIFAIGGSNDVRVWEVLGLNTIREIPGGTYVHTEANVAKSKAALDAYEEAVSGQHRLNIVAGGKEALSTAPVSSRWVEGGRGFDVRAAYDDNALFVRFDVTTPHNLNNAVADPRIMFRGGNCLDIQIATDQNADPKRTKPAPGDLRMLVTRRNRRTFAVLFRPRIAGFEGERQVLTSPTGEEAFDDIDVVEGFKLDYAGTDAGFTATVTIPHSLTGLKLKTDGKLRMDLGYIFGNADGTRSNIRAYLFNNSFSANVIDDIPNESRLEPAEWGEATVE